MCFSLLGVSLAQDRGRLEARIEVLGAELETLKKQNERDNDALKIKAKIVDDQTETIRKLKEVAGSSSAHYLSVVCQEKRYARDVPVMRRMLMFTPCCIFASHFTSHFILSLLTSCCPRPCRSVMSRYGGCVRRRLRPRRGSSSSKKRTRPSRQRWGSGWNTWTAARRSSNSSWQTRRQSSTRPAEFTGKCFM